MSTDSASISARVSTVSNLAFMNENGQPLQQFTFLYIICSLDALQDLGLVCQVSLTRKGFV